MTEAEREYGIHQMKGEGTALLTVLSRIASLTFLRYGDGSTGIFRNQQHVGTWEPAECEDSVHVFTRLLMRDRGRRRAST